MISTYGYNLAVIGLTVWLFVTTGSAWSFLLLFALVTNFKTE